MFHKLPSLLNPLASLTGILLALLALLILRFIICQPGTSFFSVHLSEMQNYPVARSYSVVVHHFHSMELNPRYQIDTAPEVELYQICEANKKQIVTIKITPKEDATVQDVVYALDKINNINKKLRIHFQANPNDNYPYERIVFVQ